MGTKQRAERPGLPLLVRVPRALFVSPDRWSAVAGQWTGTFRRRLRVLDLFILGEHGYCASLPTREPLPYGRARNVYRVRAIGMEGDALVVHLV